VDRYGGRTSGVDSGLRPSSVRASPPRRRSTTCGTRQRPSPSRRARTPKAIQARLGHASITTTLNLYGHLFPSLDVELAERLDDVRAARLRHAEVADVVEIEAAKR
jgi:integrase